MVIISDLLNMKKLLFYFALVAGLWTLGTLPASAAIDCVTGLRWSSSSNTLYISGGAVCSPSELSARYPLLVVNVGPGIYLVKVNLKLIDGSGLYVAGSAAGGSTDELRLLSDNTGAANSFVNITADYGTVTLKNTKLTSWDEAVAGPDTNYSTRAFVRVRSREVNGVVQTSRMDIADSDIGYLGYNASESYGLVWKVLGTGVFDRVDVFGDITNSHLHNNYFGAYMFGAYGMQITGNEFDHNVKYGLDPHDDSDYLTISNNKSHHNGDHGIICSQRCNNLLISGNQSYNNVGHGIMLHRVSDNNIIENNIITNNSDAGIALFESNNNLIRGNYLEGNRNSLRLSVGSSDNQFVNNTVVSSTQYGVYTYKGSDTPIRPGNDGINRRNIWTGNIISHSVSNIMKLGATDQDQFTGNDFRNNPGVRFNLSGATNTTYTANLTDPGVTLP